MKTLRRLLLAFPWILVLLFVVYAVYGGGVGDMTRGRIHRLAHDMFRDVREVDEVRIYRLGFEKDSIREEPFPIRPYDTTHSVTGLKTLSGETLKEFLEIWEWQEPSHLKGALCHAPPYAFRLFKNGSLVAETSVCWQCSNFYITPIPGNSTWYGFTSQSGYGIKLLEYCQELLPLPENPAEQQRPREISGATRGIGGGIRDSLTGKNLDAITLSAEGIEEMIEKWKRATGSFDHRAIIGKVGWSDRKVVVRKLTDDHPRTIEFEPSKPIDALNQICREYGAYFTFTESLLIIDENKNRLLRENRALGLID